MVSLVDIVPQSRVVDIAAANCNSAASACATLPIS
jgi:hypothetical protein